MSIICPSCGFSNEDGVKRCEMCDAVLGVSEPVSEAKTERQILPKERVLEEIKETAQNTGDLKRFFVNCENSRHKTYVESAFITSFYCEGCKEEHQIDGFFWTVQEETEEIKEKEEILQVKASGNVTSLKPAAVNTGRLILEDADTHVKIEILSTGGTFGRYGDFGSDYLQGDVRGRMVSGEHVRFRYEFERWSIEHLSRTNDTIYDGMKLEHNVEYPIRDGKIITLANAMRFVVRIG